jgi:hypothetical protein
MVVNLSSFQSTLSTIDGERGAKILHPIFMDEELQLKTAHQELMTILGVNAYGPCQIKILLQKFRNGDLSCMDAPRTGRSPLTLGLTLAPFLQTHLFASVRVLGQYFLMMVPTIKEIRPRELG